MIAAIRDAAVSMILASLVLSAALSVTRLVGYVRLHHPLANRRFKRRYRGKYRLTSRTTDRTQKPPAIPLGRPAGASPPLPHNPDSGKGGGHDDRP